LIAHAFQRDELQAFVRKLPEGDDLVLQLPDPPASRVQIADGLVLLLQRHGMLDQEFFRALAGERPHRTDEVNRAMMAYLPGPKPTMQLQKDALLYGGRYRLEERTDTGGFGTLWRARDTTDGTTVAIKVLLRELTDHDYAWRRTMFIRGAQRMAAIKHPNVARVLVPHGSEQGYDFCVLEFVEGRPLHTEIRTERLKADGDILRVLLDVGMGLAEVHATGVIHGDVSPRNILVYQKAGQLHASLVDFDLVCSMEEDVMTIAATGMPGTDPFAAPEWKAGKGGVDGRVDVFGLGMTTVYALARARLPASLNDPEAAIDHAAFIHRKLPSIAHPLRSALIKACSPLPAGRQLTMREFCREIGRGGGLDSVVVRDGTGAEPSAHRVDTPMNYHALLVGIDAYQLPGRALYGCVHDIDAIQRVLIEQAGVPVERVTRLVAPHAGARHESAVAGQEPTLANIRAGLERLGSAAVGPDDRVFIYYSGHGARVPVRSGGTTTWREALVPVDITRSGNFLFDYELNAFLAKVVARTRQVTVILDCCHSGGATRGPSRTVRQIDYYDDLRATGPVELAAEEHASGTRGLVGDGAGVCQVVAACLANELAEERVDEYGVRHGLLTRALLTALAKHSGRALHELRWGSIWPQLRAEVESRNPSQHLWLSGALVRAVLGGPPTEGDFGFSLTKQDDGSFAIGAGTLAGVTVGAQLAVYGPELTRFPELDSAEDFAARVGTSLLTVTRAEPGTAVGTLVEPGIAVPEGARGRVVVPGAAAMLRFAVMAADGKSLDAEDHRLIDALQGTKLVRMVNVDESEVRLVRGRSGWTLHDGLHRDHPTAPPLCRLPLEEVDRTRWLCEQYLRHSLPLRIAAQCMQGQLVVDLLDVPKDRSIGAAEAQMPALLEVGSGEYPAELRVGDRFCVRVNNRADHDLRVTLVNVAASGKVQVLGDQLIERRSMHVFWWGGDLGKGFTALLGSSQSESVNRVVVIGTMALGQDLRHLAHSMSYAEVVQVTRSGRDFGGDELGAHLPTPETWTATILPVRTRP
jgi:hypothetical protein